MSEKLVKKDVLLNADGRVKNYGFTDKLVLSYNQDCAKNKKKIKAQDSFYISDSRFALSLAITERNGLAFATATVVDFMRNKVYFNKSKIKRTLNATILSDNPEKGVSYLKTENAEFKFDINGGKTHLTGYFDNFFTNETNSNFVFDFTVQLDNKMDFLESSTFKNPYHFCFTNTICALSVAGRFTLAGKEYGIYEEESQALYEFSRGCFPLKTTMRNACLLFKVDREKLLAMKLSMGPGNNEINDKSMLCYDGKMEFIDEVKIYIQKQGSGKDYMGTWTFYSSDGKIELTFDPVALNKHKIFGLCFLHNHNQAFGSFSGKITLDDGSMIKLENVNGYADHIINIL